MIAKVLALWASIIPLAILNGAFREKILVPKVGKVAGRFLSGIILSVAVLGFTAATITWLPRSSATTYLMIGLSWAVMTIGFETALGRLVGGKSWRDLGKAYTFKDGEIWPVVLLVVAAAPYLAACATAS